MRRGALTISTLFLSALICSCGGGSNNSNITNNNPPPTGSVAPPGGSSGSGGSAGGAGGSGTSAAGLAFAGSSANQLYGILVDSSGNVSTTAGSPHSVNGDNMFLAANGNLLFVDGHSAAFDDNITTFRSDANGVLTNLGNVVADGAAFIATDSSGKFLYASADSDVLHRGFTSPAIYGFAVDQGSGKLTPLPGSPWPLSNGQSSAQIGVSPNGAYVCEDLVVARNVQGIQCYPRHADGSIDASTFVTPITAGGATTIPAFTFSADSTHVLSTGGTDNMVHSSLIASSPKSTSTSSGGSFASGIALDPTGHWLAVVNFDSATVSIMAVGSDGSLSQPGAPSAVGPQASDVAFAHSGNYLFATASDGTRAYSFDPKTGALKPLNSGKPVAGSNASPRTGSVVGM